MTSVECFEIKWFYIKYIGKDLSVEILLTVNIHDYRDTQNILAGKLSFVLKIIWTIVQLFRCGQFCEGVLVSLYKIKELMAAKKT